MTDKIIIDGVDVSGCEFLMAKGFDFPQCKLRMDYFSTCCQQCPNCYYKQLCHKEQECEELQKLKNESYFKLKEECNTKLNCCVQALEKIKGIVEDRSFYCERCSGEFNCDSCGYIKILNIINEVKDV